MPLEIYITSDFDHMSEAAAEIIEKDILEKQQLQKEYVLGLATGNSPTGIYKHLAKAFNSGRIDSGLTRTFNLDEYAGLPGENAQQRAICCKSYSFFMISEFFGLLHRKFIESHIPGAGLIEQQSLISALEISKGEYELKGGNKGVAVVLKNSAGGILKMIKEEILEAYELKIESSGGIDLQVIGVGGRGHVAFHECGIPFENNRMMLVRLDNNTVANAVADGNFKSDNECPRYAVSMGAELVYKAETVLLAANGARKQQPVTESLLGPVTCEVPISYGQRYAAEGGRMIYVLDEEAAGGVLENAGTVKEKGYKLTDMRGKPYRKVQDLSFTRNPANNMLG